MIKLYLKKKLLIILKQLQKYQKLEGPGIGTISVTNTKLNNIEFYPADERGRFVGVHTTPIGLQNLDKVYVSGLTTTSSFIGGKTYNIGISSTKLIISQGIGSVAATGLVTFFNVQGKLPSPNANLNNLAIRENDILKVGIGTRQEEVKILNIDAASSRIRVLRNQNDLDLGDGVVGAIHTATTVVEEDPRKFKIDVGFTTEFDNQIDLEYYFNPVESVGVGTTAGLVLEQQ